MSYVRTVKSWGQYASRPPYRGTLYAAGVDLPMPRAFTIPPRSYLTIDTLIHFSLFPFCGKIYPRSWIAEMNVRVFPGVIDADYRKSVKITVYNDSDKDFSMEKGDSIAQLVIEPCFNGTILWCGPNEPKEEYNGYREESKHFGFGSTSFDIPHYSTFMVQDAPDWQLPTLQRASANKKKGKPDHDFINVNDLPEVGRFEAVM